MKRIISAIFLMVLGLSTARADFNDGVVAYLMGDYETAYNTMISIAKTNENDPLPQYYLGVMYMKGQGVEQNYEEASKWLRKAAENRLPQAQYKLANLYTLGKGVPKDYETAYIWYRVGASHDHALSVNAVSNAREKLSDSEYDAAEKVISEYIEKYGPAPEKEQKDPSVQLSDQNSE